MQNPFPNPNATRASAKLIRSSMVKVKARMAVNRAYVQGMNELLIQQAMNRFGSR